MYSTTRFWYKSPPLKKTPVLSEIWSENHDKKSKWLSTFKVVGSRGWSLFCWLGTSRLLFDMHLQVLWTWFNDKYVFVGDHFVPFTSHIWPMCALIETGALRKTIFGICLISLYTIKKTAHSRTDVRRSSFWPRTTRCFSKGRRSGPSWRY